MHSTQGTDPFLDDEFSGLSPDEVAILEQLEAEPTYELLANEIAPISATGARKKTSTGRGGIKAKAKHRGRRPRKSAARERRCQKTIRRFDPWCSTLLPTALVVDAPHPRPYGPLNKRQTGDRNDRRRLPDWKSAGDLLMMEAATRATREQRMRAFTLNLSAEVERQALANAKGPITYLHDRIDKAIKRMLHFGLAFAFRPEFTVDGRFHLHGIIEVPSCQEVRVSRSLVALGLLPVLSFSSTSETCSMEMDGAATATSRPRASFEPGFRVHQ